MKAGYRGCIYHRNSNLFLGSTVALINFDFLLTDELYVSAQGDVNY